MQWKKQSVKWATNGGRPKCNIFAQDMMLENSMAPFDYPLPAGDWGNLDIEIPGWKIVTTPQRGDIAAYKFPYTNATGHMGILNTSKTIIYGGSSIGDAIGQSYLTGFDKVKWVYRRYIGN